MRKGEIIKKEEGLTIVRLKGNSYEMGYQHGELLKEEIQWFHSNAKKILSQHEGKIVSEIILPVVRRFAPKIEKLIPSQFRQEMQGVADGAKVDYNFILLENFIEELAASYGLYVKPFLQPFLRCSCFVVNDGKQLIWGRNLDYQFFSETLPNRNVLFVYFPDEGFPFLSLGWPGNIGAISGISRNLSIVLLSSPTKHRTWKGFPEEILTRQIIQYGKDLDTIFESIIPGSVPLGQNLVLITKDDAQVIELSPKKKSRRPFNLQGYLTVTNHFQNKEMETEQATSFPKPRKTIIPDEFFTLEGSKKREEKLQELCLSQNIDVKRAIEILGKVSTPGTVQSIIGLPQKEEFWMAKSVQLPVTKGQWLNFKLGDLL